MGKEGEWGKWSAERARTHRAAACTRGVGQRRAILWAPPCDLASAALRSTVAAGNLYSSSPSLRRDNASPSSSTDDGPDAHRRCTGNRPPPKGPNTASSALSCHPLEIISSPHTEVNSGASSRSLVFIQSPFTVSATISSYICVNMERY